MYRTKHVSTTGVQLVVYTGVHRNKREEQGTENNSNTAAQTTCLRQETDCSTRSGVLTQPLSNSEDLQDVVFNVCMN